MSHLIADGRTIKHKQITGDSNMPTVEGVVSAISKKERKTAYGQKVATSFQVDGKWYSGGFKTWEIDKGDEVRLSYETNAKGYDDVTGIAVLAKGAAPAVAAAQSGVPRPGRSFPIDALAPERTINRQNALTAAVNFVNHGGGATTEEVIKLARYFEAYTTGDLDRDEAQAMAEMMTGDIQT